MILAVRAVLGIEFAKDFLRDVGIERNVERSRVGAVELVGRRILKRF